MNDLLSNNNPNFEELLKRINEFVYRMIISDGNYEYVFPDAKIVMGYENKIVLLSIYFSK